MKKILPNEFKNKKCSCGQKITHKIMNIGYCLECAKSIERTNNDDESRQWYQETIPVRDFSKY